MTSIRLLIVEDQGLVLDALAALLAMEADIAIVGTATSAEDGIELLENNDVDVILTDIELPGMSGITFTGRALAVWPDLKVIIVTTFARPGYLERALKAGAAGYLLKDSRAETLADNIRQVHQGQRVLDTDLVAQAWGDRDPLTERERECLRLAGDGMTTAEIAKSIHRSEGTVRNYLSEAIGKLGAANRVEAARLARQKGWL